MNFTHTSLWESKLEHPLCRCAQNISCRIWRRFPASARRTGRVSHKHRPGRALTWTCLHWKNCLCWSSVALRLMPAQNASANGPASVSLHVDYQNTVHPPLEEKDFQILQQMLCRPPQVQRCHQPPFSQVWTFVKYVPTANVPSATQKHMIHMIMYNMTQENTPQTCGLALWWDGEGRALPS